MNNGKIQKEILQIIKDCGGETSLEHISIQTDSDCLQPDETNAYGYNLCLLFDKKKIIRTEWQNGFVRLTHLGEQTFDPLHKKIGRFLINDFAKILSMIALAFSIISMIIALKR